MKIGVLVPRSTLYPLFTMEFTRGLKMGASLYPDVQLDWMLEDIGLGNSAQLVGEKAQKLLLNEDVDVLLVYAGNDVAHQLYEQVAAWQKPMVLVNMGADPWYQGEFPLLAYHHFGLCDSDRIMGGVVAKQYPNIIHTSHFYDCGYLLGQSFEQGLHGQGGQLAVRHYFQVDPSLEGLQPLLTHGLDFSNGSFATYASFSQHNAVKFLQAYQDLDLSPKPPVFSTYTGLAWDILEKAQCDQLNIQTVTSWDASINSEESRAFQEHVSNNKNLTATPFSLLGYETGILMARAVGVMADKGLQECELIDALKKDQWTGPRGTVVFDSETGVSTCDHYLMKVNYGNSENEKPHLEKVEGAFQPSPFFSESNQATGWSNPYLCL